MIDNVGDMPLDIYSDYVSDTLGEEWSWIYFTPVFNGNGWAFLHKQGFGPFSVDVGNNVGDGYNYGYYNMNFCPGEPEEASGSGFNDNDDCVTGHGSDIIFENNCTGNGHHHPAT
jgi:hypothetical protein